MVALSTGCALSETSLDEGRSIAPADGDHQPPPDSGREGVSLREQVEAFERTLIARALRASGGNQSQAARRLSMGRSTLIEKIKKYRCGERGDGPAGG